MSHVAICRFTAFSVVALSLTLCMLPTMSAGTYNHLTVQNAQSNSAAKMNSSCVCTLFSVLILLVVFVKPFLYI